IVIELPKGGYAPVFKPRETPPASRRSIGATIAGQNTIAVLPFSDHSPARDLEYFCQGLVQEIIHRLAKLEPLRVLALPSGEPTGQDNGRDLAGRVAMVLTGGVRKSVDRIRLTIHLIDSATSSYLWSESIDAASGDIFAAQEAVAEAVVRKLEPRLVDA